VLRLHHRQTGSHGTEGWKDASEDTKLMIVQWATFPKVWILKISIKAFQISRSVSGSSLKAVFWISVSDSNLTILPDIQPAKPDSDHFWWINMDFDLNPEDFRLCDGFGFCKYKLCWTGLDNLILNFFATFRAVNCCI